MSTATADAYRRAAVLLGWTEGEAHSVGILSLRELVRPLSQKLAAELTELHRSGAVIAGWAGIEDHRNPFAAPPGSERGVSMPDMENALREAATEGDRDLFQAAVDGDADAWVAATKRVAEMWGSLYGVEDYDSRETLRGAPHPATVQSFGAGTLPYAIAARVDNVWLPASRVYVPGCRRISPAPAFIRIRLVAR